MRNMSETPTFVKNQWRIQDFPFGKRGSNLRQAAPLSKTYIKMTELGPNRSANENDFFFFEIANNAPVGEDYWFQKYDTVHLMFHPHWAIAIAIHGN